MSKSDALAVIDLAEACNLFDGHNYKAAGVCYNNIANLQYKNEKYRLAADNFMAAVQLAEICLWECEPEEVYSLAKIATMKKAPSKPD